jgi:prepilin-type processing-associated H-X9-DG protein
MVRLPTTRIGRARCRTGAGAFTIVELLVVATIIMLLITLLLPALRGARRLALANGCRANQRQLLLATHAYAQDNGNNSIPPFYNPGQDWSPPLDPYLGAGPPVAGTAKSPVFDCPANPADRGSNGWATNDYMPYMFNMNLRHWQDGSSRPMAKIRNPSKAFFILERSNQLWIPIGGLTGTWYQYSYCGLCDDFGNPTPWLAPHVSTTHIGFGDGHVETRPWNDYALIFFVYSPGYTAEVVRILEDNYWAAPWPGP